MADFRTNLGDTATTTAPLKVVIGTLNFEGRRHSHLEKTLVPQKTRSQTFESLRLRVRRF